MDVSSSQKMRGVCPVGSHMNQKGENQKYSKSSHAIDHMANERTFLAWIRTSIGIMAFGFVVEKFVLFIKQTGKNHLITY